jgi:hypothetical protein
MGVDRRLAMVKLVPEPHGAELAEPCFRTRTTPSMPIPCRTSVWICHCEPYAFFHPFKLEQLAPGASTPPHSYCDAAHVISFRGDGYRLSIARGVHRQVG